MRSSHSIAVWLFDRLGLDVALTGDLLEECAQGRSSIWYWKQVLIAIWLGIWRAILDHQLLALRAVATGCATNYALMSLYERFLQPVPLGPNASIGTWIIGLLLILFIQSVTGWVVARTHRAQPVPMVTAFAIWLMLWAIVLAIGDSYVRMLLMDSLDEPRFRPYLARYLAAVAVSLFAEFAGLYLGGIVGARVLRGSHLRQR